MGPVAALALRRPRLRPLAALLAHQTEEWVWPGGFMPWINTVVLGSDDAEFPIDRRAGLIINVGVGWGLSAAVLAGPRAAVPQAALYVSHLGNAALHVGWAVRHRRYDPGLATAALGLAPVGVRGLRGMLSDPGVRRSEVAAGVGLGLGIAVGMGPAMRLRLAARRHGRSTRRRTGVRRTAAGAAVTGRLQR